MLVDCYAREDAFADRPGGAVSKTGACDQGAQAANVSRVCADEYSSSLGRESPEPL